MGSNPVYVERWSAEDDKYSLWFISFHYQELILNAARIQCGLRSDTKAFSRLIYTIGVKFNPYGTPP